MPRKELVSALDLEAERAILNGHLPDEMAKDWYKLGSVTTDTVRGLLAVVPKKIVSNKVQSAKAAGLVPIVVDVEALALWNAYWLLVGSEGSKSETVLLANIGAQTTNLIIAKEPDELILVRDIERGKESSESSERSDLVSEIHDSLIYARSKFGLRTLDRVYVTGGESSPEMVSSLKSLVRVPIALWNPFDYIKRDPFCAALDHFQGPLFAVAIGLALRRPS
ncbi:MAG: pilus assembly protein PilM [Candidatus Aenigmarchaeota archaeon]|nr:pilus assembly protein PilM [Candidatus Aenigmarchaeota archaeon]